MSVNVAIDIPSVFLGTWRIPKIRVDTIQKIIRAADLGFYEMEDTQVIYADGKYYMFTSLRQSGANYRVYRLESDSLFGPYSNPIEVLSYSNYLRIGSIIYRDGKWLMTAWTSDRVIVAESTDLQSWSTARDPLIQPDNKNFYCVEHGTIADLGKMLMVMFNGIDPSNANTILYTNHIRAIYIEDLISGDYVVTEPLLINGLRSYSANQVSHPELKIIKGVPYLFYECQDQNDTWNVGVGVLTRLPRDEEDVPLLALQGSVMSIDTTSSGSPVDVTWFPPLGRQYLKVVVYARTTDTSVNLTIYVVTVSEAVTRQLTITYDGEWNENAIFELPMVVTNEPVIIRAEGKGEIAGIAIVTSKGIVAQPPTNVVYPGIISDADMSNGVANPHVFRDPKTKKWYLFFDGHDGTVWQAKYVAELEI